jgi:hypothetical protein
MAEKQLVYIEIEPSNPEVGFKWIIEKIASDNKVGSIIKSKVELVDLLLRDPKIFAKSVFLIRWGVENGQLTDLTRAIRILNSNVPILVQSTSSDYNPDTSDLASSTEIFPEWFGISIYDRIEELLKERE